MRIYLDTSVFSAYYDTRTPERLQATRAFWKTLKRHELLCSEVTVAELDEAESADQLTQLLAGFRVIALEEPMRELAAAYVQQGIIPARYLDDALHIAAAVYGNADVLVSWNFKHLVKRQTRLQVNALNAGRGLRAIEILAPPEL